MSCVARGVEGNSFLTGVFDGHAGPYRNGYFVSVFLLQIHLIVTKTVPRLSVNVFFTMSILPIVQMKRFKPY